MQLIAQGEPRIFESGPDRARRMVTALTLLTGGVGGQMLAVMTIFGLAVRPKAVLKYFDTANMLDVIVIALLSALVGAILHWAGQRMLPPQYVYNKRVAVGQCGRCTYDLSGLDYPRCPECGEDCWLAPSGADDGKRPKRWDGEATEPERPGRHQARTTHP